jgi:hypothetical protein
MGRFHEWLQYGQAWRSTLWPDASELDVGLDMVDMVYHAFYHYDTAVQFNDRNFHAYSDNAGGSHSSSLPRSPHPVDPESVPHDDDYTGDPSNVDPVGSVDPYHEAPIPADV